MYYALVCLCSDFPSTVFLFYTFEAIFAYGFYLMRLEQPLWVRLAFVGWSRFFIDFDLEVGQCQHGQFLSQCIYAVQLFSFVLCQSKTSHSFIFLGHIFGRAWGNT